MSRTREGGFRYRISLLYQKSLFFTPSASENASRTPGACFLHGAHIPYRRRPSPVPNFANARKEESIACTECFKRQKGEGHCPEHGPECRRKQENHSRHPKNTKALHNLPVTTAVNHQHPQSPPRPTQPSTTQHLGTKKEVPTECYFNRDFRKAAAAYSPTWWGSTIGASELNFSVRYGKRWFLTAITAAVFYLREISSGLKSWLTQKISGY